ncbi:hypothetical protein D3C87_1969920 [compost metagenome]
MLEEHRDRPDKNRKHLTRGRNRYGDGNTRANGLMPYNNKDSRYHTGKRGVGSHRCPDIHPAKRHQF